MFEAKFFKDLPYFIPATVHFFCNSSSSKAVIKMLYCRIDIYFNIRSHVGCLNDEKNFKEPAARRRPVVV